MEKYKLLGINVNSADQEDVLKELLRLSSSNKPAHVVLIDTYLLIKAVFSSNLRMIINAADIVIPVSKGIDFGFKFLNRRLKKTYNYFNLIISILLYFAEHSKFVYILGGGKKTIDGVERNIKDSFPGIRLVGKYHAEFKKDFESDLLTAVKKASPALVLVGMNSPRQEKWICSRNKKFKSGVFIGVGDFINIVGGKSVETYSGASQGVYKINKKFRNPLRIIYYIAYFFLLCLNKISNK